jgi:hypothetical protein
VVLVWQTPCRWFGLCLFCQTDCVALVVLPAPAGNRCVVPSAWLQPARRHSFAVHERAA